MISTHIFTPIALVMLLPLSQAKDVRPQEFDVWAPEILYPHAGTVWYSGGRHNVSWDTSSAPAKITNPTGMIYLVSNQRIEWDNPGALASGFSLLEGRIEIEVPLVPTGDFQLLLFGDSGNDSEMFRIIST